MTAILRADTSDFLDGLNLLKPFPEVLNSLFGSLHLFRKLFCVRCKTYTTMGTFNITAVFERTELFGKLLAALRAGDFHVGIVEEFSENIIHAAKCTPHESAMQSNNVRGQ